MEITVSYSAPTVSACVEGSNDIPTTVWNRIVQCCTQADPAVITHGRILELGWAYALPALVEIGSMRTTFGFAMRAIGEAQDRLQRFQAERRAVRESRQALAPQELSAEDIDSRLVSLGFVRSLKDFQKSDVARLLNLRHGANFSVPGAGKTTVTLALYLLLRSPDMRLFVVAPKNALGAWIKVVGECMRADAPEGGAEPFTVLEGDDATISTLLGSNRKRFVISYDKLTRVTSSIASYLSRHPVHFVLDESHRIKAGDFSQRGRTVLALAPLPVRKDILSGTPVPNELGDIWPQIDFLWSGLLLGHNVYDVINARRVLQHLYVRTTKSQLGLPAPIRTFVSVPMGPAQLGLYSVIRSEVLRQLSGLRSNSHVDIIAARRSVMRLLQVSANPVAAVIAMTGGSAVGDATFAELARRVLEEGDSAKVVEACTRARALAAIPRKVVIWTIFRHTIDRLEALLPDLHPVILHGGVPTGDERDDSTREGRIRKFHEDPSCMVMIANPAACSEGISLHQICHEAVYVDRSYNAAHYLQSIDRIHRLGLAPGEITNITILQSVAPAGLGSIDYSVSRRLATKLRTMETILNDQDLRQIALDEEEADPPVDRDIELEDLQDLLDQLLSAIPLRDVDQM